jgi:hypothetical protein
LFSGARRGAFVFSIQMTSTRKSAVLAGMFFIVAAVAAIVGLALYDPILNDSRYIVDGSADDTQVLLGALFELILAISVIGTAATLYPIVKRENEGIALGYVAGRVSEAVIIVVGIISLVSIVTLGQDSAGGAGDQTAALVTTGEALVAIHDWTFLFGPGLAIGVNTLLLAYLMYRSGLVPRPIAVIGLIGGPLIFASSTAVLFGLYEQVSAWGSIAAIPVFTWEMSLAVWLIARGFKATAITSGATQRIGMDPLPA